MSKTVLIAAMIATLASAPESVSETEERIAQEQEQRTVTSTSTRNPSNLARSAPSVTARDQIITVTVTPTPEQSPSPSSAVDDSEPSLSPEIVIEESPEPEVTETTGSSPNTNATTQDSPSPGTIPGVSLELEQRFDRLAECESNGDWSINTGNGFYGGLQFTPSTWDAFGGEQYAPDAHQATREQQIEIAANVLDGQGWGAWPACTASFGWR